jgi:putative transposase
MLTVNELIERTAHRQVRKRVRTALQPGTVTAIVAAEVSSLIAAALNEQLVAERDQALGREPWERTADSPQRNGFKRVSLPGFWGRLCLRRPVVRKGTLKLPLLSALRVAGQNLCAVLATRFWLRGASTRAVAEELRAATGAKLSASTVSTLTNALEPTLRTWENRPVPASIRYLFLDALFLPVHRPGFTRPQALLVALGVDDQDRRHMVGFTLGDRENQDSWEALIQDLLKRGLNVQNLRLVISDEHKGIESAVARLLGVAHQLCIVHLLRNVKARVAAPNWKAMLADLHAIFWAKSREEALRALGACQARWENRYPKAIEILTRRFDDHLHFFKEPEPLWTLLRSSNLIERFNRELRRRLRPAGAMHSELEVLKLVWAVSEAQQKRWDARRVWRTKTKKQEPLAA